MVIFHSYVSIPEGNETIVKSVAYPLVNVYITMEKIHHAINGKIHDKWPCSIAMLNYQRVPLSSTKIHQNHLPSSYFILLWDWFFLSFETLPWRWFNHASKRYKALPERDKTSGGSSPGTSRDHWDLVNHPYSWRNISSMGIPGS